MKQLALGAEKDNYDMTSAVALQIDGTEVFKTLSAAALVHLRIQVGNVTGTLAGAERIEVNVYVTPATDDKCLMTQFVMDVPAGQDFVVMQVPPFYGASGDKIEVEVVSNDAGDSSVGAATWMFDISAQSAIVENKLDHLVAVADADDVVDDSIIAKLASKDATADWSDYDNTTDSHEALADSLVAGFPTNEHADVEPDGGEIVTGTNEANDGDSTWLNNGTYWQIEPAGADGDGFGLSVIQTFTIGTSLRVSQIAINAKETMVGVVHVWAYNYTTVGWDQLSDTSTAISGSSDNDYTFPLLSSHQQTSDGEIKIRYTSTTTAANKYLYIDQALISANPTGSGPTVGEIGEAVWTNRFGHDVAHHVPK